MILNFKKPLIDDKNWVAPILEKSGCFASDCAFGTLFIWSDVYNTKICKYNNFLLKLYGKNSTFYGFPMGEGDITEAIYAMYNDSKERNMDFKLYGITETMAKRLEKEFPNKFEFNKVREMADYIYNAKDLSVLSGKKYHSKRNHISKFSRVYNWSYEPITNSNIKKCEDFVKEWFEEEIDEKDNSIKEEILALNKTFKNYFSLGFTGALIKENEKIVALTMGEKINKNVFLTHFEKALKSYVGAYAVINCEFAKQALSEYKYINREEDMGIEGLRKAKESYHPIVLLEKYSATLKEDL